MTQIDRRRVLGSVVGGLGATLGGCLTAGSGNVPDNGDSGTDPAGTRTRDPTQSSPSGADVGYEVRQFAITSSAPEWYRDEGRPGAVAYYGSASTARDGLDFDAVSDDRRADLVTFVDGTDFDRARLLFVESAGPDTCHRGIAVDDLSVSGDALVGAAHAVDTSAPDEGCGDALTFPSAIVRVQFDDQPRNRVRLAVTDGWEREATLEATAERSAIDPATLPGHVRPDGDPPAVPEALTCDDAGFRRHYEGFSGKAFWGETDDESWGNFALRTDRLVVRRGETVTITLTNLGPGEALTGNRHKYNLQVRTEAGWQDVRGFAGGQNGGYTDEAVAHQRGDGFRWQFGMTPAGVVSGHVHEDDLGVCPGLPAGRYRFVFWEPTVAVAVDLRD